MVSLASWLNLSGNFTSNSTTRSPRRSGVLGKGSPSPVMRLFMPGRMISCTVTETDRPSSVGALTVQPQRAWKRERGSLLSIAVAPNEFSSRTFYSVKV